MSLTEPHHGMIHYHQSQATFLMTNTWGGNGVSPYAANMPDDGITLDPSLRANDFWNRHALEFNQPIFQAGPWGNQYIGPSFRGTNMPAQGTNRFTEGIYYPDHPPRSSLQYISTPQVANEFRSDRTSFPYYTPIASKHYIPPPAGAVENAESCTGNGKRKCRESTSDAHRHEDLGQSVHEDQHSMQKQMISTRPKKAAGGNHSAQARYRVVNNEKLVLVGDDWSM